MRPINRKLIRELRLLRGQVLAVALVVACGIITLVTMRTAYSSLLESQQSYYSEYRFADVFAQLRRAPRSLEQRIAAIPGVAAVETRVMIDVVVDVPGLEEPATGRLLSIPDQGRPVLNDVHLLRGALPARERDDEVVASASFVEANGLDVGSTIGAVINGRWKRLRIAGVGLSPEYVYEIRPGDIFPDNRRFGILWMRRNVLGPAYQMEGAFNDVSLALGPRASEPEVIAALDRILEPWGGLGAYGRYEQVSNRFLSDEIAQNRVNGIIVPAIFLGVAVFLVHIVLTRLIQTQRGEIGVLKAFGYSNREVALHYIGFAVVPLVAATIAGIALGAWLASGLAALYADFFRFPVIAFRLAPSLVAASFGVAVATAAAGAFSAVRRAAALPPAVAMRSEAPPTFHPGIVERLGLHRHVSPAGRITLRNLSRRKTKALLSAVGIAMAVAILIVGRWAYDAMDYLIAMQFGVVQREDMTVGFVEARGSEALHDLRSLPGVMKLEPYRTIAVRLVAGHRSRRTALTGMPPAPELRRIVDSRERPIEIPQSGIVMNSKLAEVLGVRVGDVLRVEVLEGHRPVRHVPLVRVSEELIGVAAYASIATINDIMDEGNSVSGVHMMVDPLRQAELYARLKQTPAVAGVSIRAAALRSFQETIAESYMISNLMLVIFACAIAIAVVYNNARIALSERSRELASLRVLGFRRREVSAILLGEQGAITLFAIPFGYAIGYVFCLLLSRSLETELYRFPVIISGRSYAFAFLVIAGAAALAAAIVLRRIRHLDLVDALKARE
jgi:putative ABC transport system permease protein